MNTRTLFAAFFFLLFAVWSGATEHALATESDQIEDDIGLEASMAGNTPAPGSDLENRMKAVLAALNEYGESWQAALSEEERLDTWGTPFQVERLAERDAGLEGYEYIVHSAGKDREFGTSDDITLHDEAHPGFQPSPLLVVPEPDPEWE